MVTKVQKWGNSQGLRFTREVLQEANIKVGDEVRVSVRGGRIFVEPLTKVRGKYKLQDLIDKIPKEKKSKGQRSKELDWGSPVGEEAW